MTRIAYLGVGLFAALLYLPTLFFGFVNYDDPWLIQNNTTLHTLNVQSLSTVWLDTTLPTRLRLGSEYLPIRDMSVMLDYTLYGSWIGGQHLTQIILYGILCVLLVWLLRTWLLRPSLAWMAGLLFATHPLHVESVAWLSERKGLLAAVWMLLAYVAFYHFAKGRHLTFWWLSVLCMACGIWSKAIALMGVPFLGALLWLYPPLEYNIESTQEKGFRSHPSLRQGIGWLLFALCTSMAFIPFWWVSQKTQMTQGYHGGSWLSNALLAGEVHTTYLQQLFYSGGYAIQYPLSAKHPHVWRAILGWLAGCAIVLVCLGSLWRKGAWRLLGLATCCWIIFLLPVSQMLVQIQNYIADRYMLLPSLAWALLLAAGIQKVVQNQRLQWTIVSAFCLVGGIYTMLQTQSWSSSKTLHSNVLTVHPKSIRAHLQLYRIYAKQGHTKRAWRHLLNARKIAPNHPKVRLQESFAYLRMGRIKRAIQTLRVGTQYSQNDKIRANLALLLLRINKKKEALRWAKEAVQIRPNIEHNQRTLGLVALRSKHYTLAQAAFHAALRLQPHNPQNLHNLAVLYMRIKQIPKAQMYLQKAQRYRRK